MPPGIVSASRPRSPASREPDMHKALLSLTGLLLAAWPGAAAQAQESQLDVVLKRDKLIVATYSTSPPLAYIAEAGKLAGFEIYMAREIAKDLPGDPNKA